MMTHNDLLSNPIQTKYMDTGDIHTSPFPFAVLYTTQHLVIMTQLN